MHGGLFGCVTHLSDGCPIDENMSVVRLFYSLSSNFTDKIKLFKAPILRGGVFEHLRIETCQMSDALHRVEKELLKMGSVPTFSIMTPSLSGIFRLLRC